MKKKIIYFMSRFNIGGVALVVSISASHFNNEDYECYVLYGSLSESEGDMSYLAKENNLKLIKMETVVREISILGDIKSFINLYRFFKREKPDIVHTHMAKAGTVGRIAAWLAGVPQIYHTFHGHVFKGYFSPLKTKLIILIERFLALLSTKIIAISEIVKNDLEEFKIAKSEKIELIPIAFDFTKVIPRDEKKGLLKKDYSISEDKTVVAIIGRLCPIKNHKLFFEIAKKVLSKTKKVQFVIVGDGELREDCKQMALDTGFEENITFTGFITDLQYIYGSTDIVLLTSLNEGTPVSLLEAMICRKLVLSTNVGGVSDFVKTGKNGYCLDFNPESFSDIIIDYIQFPDKYSELSENAYNDISESFDKNRLFRDLEKLYSNLL